MAEDPKATTAQDTSSKILSQCSPAQPSILCPSLQDNHPFDPTISIAFQTLLKYRQITCLLVDRQHCLLHICGDALGLLGECGKDITSQNILELLPASLKLPTGIVLNRAQTDGEAKCSGCAVAPPNGTPYTVTVAASRHSTGEIGEVLTVLIERDERERLETSVDPHTTELIEVNNRLRAKVLEQQQTEQKLAHQAQALARSNADLEEFAYVVSHDLQEPLRAMTAFSQLLEQRYGQQLDASAQRYITHIVDGGTRMKAMIDGILELSRINNQQITHSPTSLEQALEIALENLELMRIETQATITHDVLPTLYIDKNHIVQLLQNLIGNAIKFRGPDSPQVHITAEQQASSWLFSVHDNGIGIPQPQQKRIFKLFQRLHNQQEQEGYGIGLAICKKIVEHHQGGIWLESSPGEGSTFYFTLAVDTCQSSS
ncbi:MAG: ATP-binding protein [Cyanobacteria bacterium P01_A01_bin.137]